MEILPTAGFNPHPSAHRPGSAGSDPTLLMRRVALGDWAAFESLYATYNRMVFSIGLQLLGDAASAEDLRQSVFIKVWSQPASFKGGSFGAWIARVARNGGVDVLRQRSTHAKNNVFEPFGGSFEDLVVAAIDAELAAVNVRSAIARLPHSERLLIELGYFRGMTHQGLALATGVPLGTVKTRIRAGLRRLRGTLGDAIDRTG